jgi:hypothetical protein
MRYGYPPKQRSHPFLRGIFWIVLILGVLSGVAYLWIRHDEAEGKKAWEAYRAEAAARGVKLDLRDFLRPPIPAANNFAATTLFQIPAGEKKLPNPFKLPERVGPRTGTKNDALSELEAVRADFTRAGWIPKADSRPTPVAVWTALARYDPPRAQLLQAAARPDAQFAVPWAVETQQVFAPPPLDHLLVLLSAGYVSKIRAQIHLVSNRPAEALQEWRLIWRLAQTLRREPTLVCWMVQVSLQQLALTILEQGLERHAWTHVELEEIERAVGAIDVLADFTWSYASERASLNGELLNFHDALNAEGRRRYVIRRLGEEAPKTDFFDRFIGIYHSLVRFNRDTDHALSELDIAQHRFAPKETPAEPAGFGLRDYRRYLLYRLVSLNYRDVANKGLFLTTRFDQARVACALERHRLAHGAYPETLAALSPDFLKAIPHDIFDGQPLRYERRAEKFVLYSVGPDLKDNHVTAKESLDDSKDWVWGIAGK